MQLASTPPIGSLLRGWRLRRRLSQLELAGEAEVSTRHLSCLETGRAVPSREMVLRLAQRLDVPLRERNRLLAAAGYAPMFAERAFADPALAAARRAVDLVLRAHEPWPALAVDRHWTLVAHNAVVPLLLADVSPALREPPINVLRLSLHPDGMAPRIHNLHAWRKHLLHRLESQAMSTGDPVLRELLVELRGYPEGAPAVDDRDEVSDVAVPLRLDSRLGRLGFISTTTVFGTPTDITLSEIALETFLPADAATQAALQKLTLGD